MNFSLLRRACLAGLLFCATISHAATQQLNLFIWSEYIDPQVVSDFEKKFDCKVVIDLYEDAESMLAKIQGGGVSLYDVVVPPDHMVTAMAKLNLLAPLNRVRIPNFTNIEPTFLNPPYDSRNRFTIPYQWGTVGLFVRSEKGKPVPNSWSVLFDPKQQTGQFVLIDSVRDMIGAALKYKGFSLNSVEPKELKMARDLITDAKQRSAGFDGSVGAKNRVMAKAARAAIVYSGEGVRGMSEDTETIYVIPKEGSQIWVDNLAILAQAPHKTLAEDFLNYILDGKVGARISSFTQFASPNQAAKAFMKSEDLKNPAIYPPSDVKAKLEFLQDLGAKTRLYDEIWTQIKSK